MNLPLNFFKMEPPFWRKLEPVLTTMRVSNNRARPEETSFLCNGNKVGYKLHAHSAVPDPCTLEPGCYVPVWTLLFPQTQGHSRYPMRIKMESICSWLWNFSAMRISQMQQRQSLASKLRKQTLPCVEGSHLTQWKKAKQPQLLIPGPLLLPTPHCSIFLKDELVSIPFFIKAGNNMTKSSIYKAIK